uniref:Prophage protein n=1 Tax=uncultured bacterium scaffold00056 TaxID=1132475 RepID=I7ARM6_9BACT|nr:prophage protein [uncultured bacterium scaffold00056]
MATKAANQLTLIDLTDAYSVILTNEAHTWIGDTDGVSGTQTATTQIMALCGSEQVSCSVGTITCPTGIAAVSDGKTPSPTVTITATSAVTAAGTITIPVLVDDGEITINKVFSYSIAFTGATGETGNGISKIETFYLTASASSGVTTSTSGWSTAPTATTTTNKYIWSYQKTTYTDGTTASSTPAIIGTHGATGATGATGETGNGVDSITTYYLTTSAGSGVTTSATGWSTTPTATTTTNKYIWSYQKITYTDGTSEASTPAIIGTHGATGATGAAGADGADAITLIITSSAGIIFKNTSIATTLTAHVYQGGTEVTGTALTALGTISWYKDGGTTAIATGQTLTISAGDVTNSASYTAQLEA